ncbi:MAG: hypothetical protein JSS89_11745 [Bacteroidetes bacterium]|nr:hypothetical protein [Bacteroidota bacterium]
MPLKLSNNVLDTEVILDRVEFIDEGNVSYFKVSSIDHSGVKFHYYPEATSGWDKEWFEIYLFENPYLNAENDVFQVYESTHQRERLGWIFPITILESNDNDYRDYLNLNNYKYIAYCKLLELDVSISENGEWGEYRTLAEVFGNVVVCIMSKDAIAKIADFRIENYVLSFYRYGYLLFGGSPKSKAIYDRSEFVSGMRRKDRTRVLLKKAVYNITSNEFIKSLYMEHLLQSDHYLVRFILLYQIVEYFIEEKTVTKFNEYIERYQKGEMTKNDFRESVNRSSSERSVVASLLNTSLIDGKLKAEFENEAKFLLADIGRVMNTRSFADCVYSVRNLVTHSYRDLATYSDRVKRLTELFECVITELLINADHSSDR